MGESERGDIGKKKGEFSNGNEKKVPTEISRNDPGLMASSADCGSGCFRQNSRISSHVLWLPGMTVN